MKYIVSITIGLITLISIAWLALWQVGGLTELIRKEIYTNFDGKLQFDTLEIHLPFTVHLTHVRYGDAYVEDVDATLSPSMFFDEKIHLTHFDAKNVQFEDHFFSHLQGSLYFDPASRAALGHIVINDATRFSFSNRPREEQDHLFVEVEESKHGFIAQLFQKELPIWKGQLQLAISGKDWQKLLHTPWETAAESSFTLTTEEGSLTANFHAPGNQTLFVPSFTLDADEVKVKGSLTYASDGNFTGDLHHANMRADLVGKFRDKILTLDSLHIDREGKSWTANSPLRADFSKENNLQLTYGPLKLDGSLQDDGIHLNAQGELHEILQHIVKETVTISGQIQIAFILSGSVEKPQVAGQASITNGIYENRESGAIFRHIQGQLIGAGDKIKLVSLEGKDIQGGQVKATGEIDLSANYKVQLQLDHALLFHTDVVIAIASGQALLTGDFDKALFKGQLEAHSIHVDLQEEQAKLTKPLDVVYINTYEGFVPPVKPAKPEDAWPILMDLEVKIPETLYVIGENLDSTWKGTLHVTGTDDIPLLEGDLHAVNGYYSFNGQRFDMSQGTITFNKTDLEKGSLYIVLGRDLKEIIAEVIVRGPIENPSIVFRSNPPKSQRDILSWILFGIGSSNISPDQGGQLNQTLKSLQKGGAATPNVFSQLRNTFGIDRIDISRSSDDDSAVSVKVGKYISRGVYVSINKSFSEDANCLAIEAELIKDVKLQAEIGDDAQAEILLKWKRDY